MKKLLLVGALALGVVGLVGCEENSYYFEGKLQKESRIQEIIEDRLESQLGEENDMEIDVDVNIMEEAGDE
ncbi:hypothetical protein [Bacillus phage Anath]|uniref:Lipoprotein n=1 Tax=Bacillus phage Anath TaxID=2108114 RepID=A0A2P1JUR3_9CAUD|nr:hypothetical protein [Bacillus phage Anath]